MPEAKEIKQIVREHYTKALQTRGCCGDGATGSSCSSEGSAPSPEERFLPSSGYQEEEIAKLPEEAREHSFGCGNPVAFAGVGEGQVVIDIGSGAGMDCLLAAERVGPEGRVIGLDMTPAMIDKARANARAAGKTNVEFRLGEAESMPVEDGTADWIVSNCVINLAPDKERVFREAFRALRPGGRLSVSDIVARIPWLLRRRRLYAACLSGALPEEAYLAAVRAAGFRDVRVVARHVYDVDELAVVAGREGLEGRLLRLAARRWIRPWANRVLRRVASIQVMATKPKSREVAA